MLVIGAADVAAVVKFKVKERSPFVVEEIVGAVGVVIGVAATTEERPPSVALLYAATL
jgi:hypothetical protein